jgi:AbrB family looped-hinge helix DNA binding protein
MLVNKVSSKRQVTIPKEVRGHLRAGPGDFIEYEVEGEVVVVRCVEPFDRAPSATL